MGPNEVISAPLKRLKEITILSPPSEVCLMITELAPAAAYSRLRVDYGCDSKPARTDLKKSLVKCSSAMPLGGQVGATASTRP